MLPGTMRNIVMDYLQRNSSSSSKIGRDYDVCYNPEFLRQNTAFDDFFRPDRVVIGEDGKGVSQPLKEIYQQLTENIIVTSFEAAEMIKYTSNCFLSLKISFFNEIGLVCKQMGIDDKAVSLGVSMDKRIGNYGTQFGKPFEGACLPKDTEALAGFIRNLQLNPDLLQVALDINRKMEELTSSKTPYQTSKSSHCS
jgi:UDPglucose 6-dehydrogenase